MMTEHDWTLPQYMELMEERLGAIDKARKLQATEYERRLDGLNHEHARVAALANTYISLEKFDDFLKRYEQEKAATAKALALAEGKDTRNDQLRPWQLWVAGAVLTMVVVIVNVGILLIVGGV